MSHHMQTACRELLLDNKRVLPCYRTYCIVRSSETTAPVVCPGSIPFLSVGSHAASEGVKANVVSVSQWPAL